VYICGAHTADSTTNTAGQGQPNRVTNRTRAVKLKKHARAIQCVACAWFLATKQTFLSRSGREPFRGPGQL